jgi:hypothetical protein
LLERCGKGPPHDETCTAPNGRTPEGAGTDVPLIMLWLPWTTLGALELVRNPLTDAKESELDGMRLAARALVVRLATHGDMNVDSYRYEPAEMLLAMAESLRLLHADTPDA